VKLLSVILNVPNTFERIIRFYAKQFSHKPLLIDLTAGKRKMYGSLFEISNLCDYLFCDVTPSVNPNLVCDSRFLPLREGCCDIAIIDLPYPTKLMSWSRRLYNTISMERYRKLARKMALETRRILRKDGILVWKCIDVFLKKQQRLLPIHINVVNWAREAGLRLWDIVIAIEPRATASTYRRSVGLHTYFLIFRRLK